MKTLCGLLLAVFLGTLALGTVFDVNPEDAKMLFASTKAEVRAKRPPMDQNVPARTETATFALG